MKGSKILSYFNSTDVSVIDNFNDIDLFFIYILCFKYFPKYMSHGVLSQDFFQDSQIYVILFFHYFSHRNILSARSSGWKATLILNSFTVAF